MRTHISWAEKVTRVSQEIRVGNHPPLPAPAQTTPDSSGSMIKCPRELNQLKNRAFSLGYFPPGKFHSPQKCLYGAQGWAGRSPGSSANSDCSHGLWLPSLVCEGWWGLLNSAGVGSATSSCWTPLAAGHHTSSPSGVQRKLTWAKSNQKTAGFYLFIYSFFFFWRGFQNSTVKHNFVMGI